MPGFEEAGRSQGPGYDFLGEPEGRHQLAKSYMKKAGTRAACTGTAEPGDLGPRGPGSKDGQAFQAQITKIGFKLKFRAVQHVNVISSFAARRSRRRDLPDAGWGRNS